MDYNLFSLSMEIDYYKLYLYYAYILFYLYEKLVLIMVFTILSLLNSVAIKLPKIKELH